MTEQPVRIGPASWVWCTGPTPAEARAREAEAKSHGPHAVSVIVVRVSPESASDFRAGQPLRPGAVVIKEKYADESATGRLWAYGVMVKREPGYDPDNGDWEYGYIDLGPETAVSRGRLVECIDCHRQASGRDYLFRPYLKTSRPAD